MRLGPKGLIGLGRPKALVNVGGGRLQGVSSPPQRADSTSKTADTTALTADNAR